MLLAVNVRTRRKGDSNHFKPLVYVRFTIQNQRPDYSSMTRKTIASRRAWQLWAPEYSHITDTPGCWYCSCWCWSASGSSGSTCVETGAGLSRGSGSTSAGGGPAGLRLGSAGLLLTPAHLRLLSSCFLFLLLRTNWLFSFLLINDTLSLMALRHDLVITFTDIPRIYL